MTRGLWFVTREGRAAIRDAKFRPTSSEAGGNLELGIFEALREQSTIEFGSQREIRFGSPDQGEMPEITGMKRRFVFRISWQVVNALTVASALLLLNSIGSEASTRRYLRGFSDAIVPATAPAEEKVESILSGMAHGPARLTDDGSRLTTKRIG